MNIKHSITENIFFLMFEIPLEKIDYISRSWKWKVAKTHFMDGKHARHYNGILFGGLWRNISEGLFSCFIINNGKNESWRIYVGIGSRDEDKWQLVQLESG